jgi:hypothetical protein
MASTNFAHETTINAADGAGIKSDTANITKYRVTSERIHQHQYDVSPRCKISLSMSPLGELESQHIGISPV